ncbi:spore germination protein GerPE [Niallia sp. XMNu-256]|uniref:spore germination protein GerPE n=1 Tax=Niallia sp. XMNu-256 TaxID=3082444 RepID=UPI0030CC3836
MLARISKVDNVKVKSVIFGSYIQIGDSNEVNGLARVLAVQRQREVFYSNEGDFSLFNIYSYSLPLPPINEPIGIHTTSPNPIIKVGSIDVTAMSTSAFMHIGNTEHIRMESRVLHIRQLETIDEPMNPT